MRINQETTSTSHHLSESEIRTRLGLADPAWFELTAIRGLVDVDSVSRLGIAVVLARVHGRRATGRTTRVLVDALVALSAGKAVILSIPDRDRSLIERHRVAGAAREEAMVERAREMAEQLGLESRFLFTSRTPHTFFEGREPVRFCDHSITE